MNYFTADIHFCDESSMKSDNRPFKSVKEDDKFTIKHWNKTAKIGDTIYVAGDLLDCDGPTSTEWVKGLNLIKKVKADDIAKFIDRLVLDTVYFLKEEEHE